ncbi:hypothetical protein EVAR_3928_1 [Eumeta japonica]|uniref:Uncharacterized protein n=1 Tax=Eumeta variegata TaxID=151549 RepID=A0A4C1STK0_EUMVA|nr:hypothetical protein EVAR_3928_1 [Eumeta japonica]
MRNLKDVRWSPQLAEYCDNTTSVDAFAHPSGYQAQTVCRMTRNRHGSVNAAKRKREAAKSLDTTTHLCSRSWCSRTFAASL